MKSSLLAASILAGAVALGGQVQAAWPEKPITVVVPFQAGGTSDQVTRAFQAAIQENDILDQPITIINVGGHYSIGSRRVLEAEPDGYEFLTIHVALMGGEGTGVLDFSWRDFTPVAATGQFCVLPVVRKDSGIDSVDDLLAKAAAEPDTLIFGANLGAINHMAGIMLQNTEPGAKFRFVQIGGGTANFTALTGSQTNATVLSGAEVINFTRLPDGSTTRNRRSSRWPTPAPSATPSCRTCRPCWSSAATWSSASTAGGSRPRTRRPRRSRAWPTRSSRPRRASGSSTSTKSQAFAPLFLKGEELQQSLDDTWARIEPVAKQAAQK